MSGGWHTMSAHLGGQTLIGCHTYPDSGPILYVSSAGLRLMVSVDKHGTVTPDDVRAARKLADAVQTYLAECERVCAAQAQTPESSVTSEASPGAVSESSKPGTAAEAA